MGGEKLSTMSIDQTPKNAVLVALQLPKTSNEEVEGSLLELTRLVTTLGYNTVGRLIQKRSSEKLTTVLGDGKLKELAEWTGGTGVVASMVQKKLTKAAVKRLAPKDEDEEEEIDDDDGENLSSPEKKSANCVIVDAELSPSQIRNLESATGVPVLDRTGVIIEIFSRHARTRVASLQVEIARLTYLAPRIRETGGEDRQVGGGGKGLGESRLELDKRKIRDRIKELKEELEAIGSQQDVRRTRREKEICVALVGYTNAGKSSLMRAMTGSDVLVADKLFATLDTTVRALYPETTPKILLSDTVGFIKKLPHDLVASFKSTLDEALNASLLLFVVDSSDPAFRSQLEVTQKTLEEVGATDVPSLVLLNKRDCLTSEMAEELQKEFPNALMISTRNPEDLKKLRETVLSYFEKDMIDHDLFIPYNLKGIVGDVRAKMRVLSESYNEEGAILRVRTTPENLAQIEKKMSSQKPENL